MQDWTCITLTVMKGEDFSSPGRILLTATGYAENTNMGWKSQQRDSVGRDWGAPPSLVEVVPAEVTLPAPPQRVQVWPLDETGQRAEELPVEERNGRALVRIGPPARTLWYEVVIG